MKTNKTQNYKITNLKELGIKLSNQKTMWQNGLFYAVIISLVIFICAMSYIFFRPLSSDMKQIINEEINSSNVTFNEKVIEDLSKKQQPIKSSETTVGKNPFLPF